MGVNVNPICSRIQHLLDHKLFIADDKLVSRKRFKTGLVFCLHRPNVQMSKWIMIVEVTLRFVIRATCKMVQFNEKENTDKQNVLNDLL